MRIGVDLGTTYSVAAYMEDDTPRVLKNSMGNKKTPSVVQFKQDETVIVGEAADRQKRINPDQTVDKIKRYMGIEEYREEVLGEKYRPETVSGFILEKILSDAEEQTGADVEKVVITIPADFTTKEREATYNAATIARENLTKKDIKLLTEPVAACIAYGVGRDTRETVFVYDMGGGTFDATIVESGDGEFIEEGITGSQRLGGEDFDEAFYEFVRSRVVEDGCPDPDNHGRLKAEVMDEVTEAKHTLSDTEESQVMMNRELFSVSRDEFNECIQHLVNRSLDDVDRLFNEEDIGVARNDIDRVILVGGSTRVPAVQQAVEEYFGMSVSRDLDQDLVVARGAAIHAEHSDWGQGGDSEITTRTVLPETIGIDVNDEEYEENLFETIMERQERIAEDGTKVTKGGFGKADKHATELNIRLLQGGSPFAKDNEQLGKITVTDLEPGSDPEFEVEFEVSPEARLTVTVQKIDQSGTRQVEAKSIVNDIGLSEEEIEEARGKLRGESNSTLTTADTGERTRDSDQTVRSPDSPDQTGASGKTNIYQPDSDRFSGTFDDGHSHGPGDSGQDGPTGIGDHDTAPPGGDARTDGPGDDDDTGDAGFDSHDTVIQDGGDDSSDTGNTESTEQGADDRNG